MNRRSVARSLVRSALAGAAAMLMLPFASHAQDANCPAKNVNYWQAFPAGGESDLSARHQQGVLKKRCNGIDALIQYKPGAGGGLMWAQMNNLPGDGLNVVGINLPHIFLQPLEQAFSGALLRAGAMGNGLALVHVQQRLDLQYLAKAGDSEIHPSTAAQVFQRF